MTTASRATQFPPHQAGKDIYDVVIVGGSFAGPATAIALRNRRVLIVEQYPIGSHQMSTCGAPLDAARLVGADASIQEAHDTIIMHAAGQQIQFSLPEPYVTFEYYAFCQAMVERIDAVVWRARATGYCDGVVETTAGGATGRFVVDAAGWRSFMGQSVQEASPIDIAGRGIETELPVRLDLTPGLHFFFEGRIVPRGYAWIFPCGDRTRIGLGSAQPHADLRQRLGRFVGELGLEVGATHGGVMPVVRRDPIAGEIFVVGDAAGQCLPVTAEGIRVAMLHGLVCGQLIGATLDGKISAEEARRRYRDYVSRKDRFHGRLLKTQAVVERTPERLLALGALICSPTPIAHRILRRYLRSSGWRPNVQPTALRADRQRVS